jgi:NADPH:quinone reductase-like Zn-dependent oxidoreductase
VALARRRSISTLVIVRSDDATRKAIEDGARHVLGSDHPDFLQEFADSARRLEATAIFDGVGGSLISRLMTVLPPRSVVSFYGFLSGTENIAFRSAIFMMKDLTCRRFSNFDSAVVREELKLKDMLDDLETCIDNPAFKTMIGRTFDLSDFDAALAFHEPGGGKAAFTFK